MSLSSHQSARMKNDEWLTPPEILAKLGTFDLDPCSPVVRPWPTATRHLTVNEDGLVQRWNGRVWLNPPFGDQAIQWMYRMVEHGNGIALLPARTETALFYETVWLHADAVCFLRGRPHFHYVDGTKAKANSGAPICLIAYGEHNAQTLVESNMGAVTRWERSALWVGQKRGNVGRSRVRNQEQCVPSASGGVRETGSTA